MISLPGIRNEVSDKFSGFNQYSITNNFLKQMILVILDYSTVASYVRIATKS